MAKKNIQWKGEKRVTYKRYTYHPDVPLPSNPETRRIIGEALVPGTLWFTQQGLSIQSAPPGVQPHMYPYSGSLSNWGDRRIPMGSIAIYAGQTRVEEMDSLGRNVSVLRHTFLIGGDLVMTRDVHSWFVPTRGDVDRTEKLCAASANTGEGVLY